jgi:ATP-dependent DNA helicase DinG
LDVGSPFDHGKQGILYVASHLPARGASGRLDDAVLDEIVSLVEAAGGRTLGLFSSRWAAEAAADAVRDRIGVPLLTQWDAPVPQVVARFAAEPRTCLFGTLSLWQGVDVPGTACTLVLIDKIPFPHPDDPLVAARQKAVDEAGRSGFMAISVPRAALLLAQGVGRLIRSDDDRGVVAVLDPRLRTARYGAFLVKSLPPYWTTTDPERVRASLRALDDAATISDAAGAVG